MPRQDRTHKASITGGQTAGVGQVNALDLGLMPNEAAILLQVIFTWQFIAVVANVSYMILSENKDWFDRVPSDAAALVDAGVIAAWTTHRAHTTDVGLATLDLTKVIPLAELETARSKLALYTNVNAAPRFRADVFYQVVRRTSAELAHAVLESGRRRIDAFIPS